VKQAQRHAIVVSSVTDLSCSLHIIARTIFVIIWRLKARV